MSYIFYDILSFIIILFMGWESVSWSLLTKPGVTKQSFPYDICLLLFGDARYTSLDHT